MDWITHNEKAKQRPNISNSMNSGNTLEYVRFEWPYIWEDLWTWWMDVTGEMGHDFQEATESPAISNHHPSQRTGLSKLDAMQQAGKEISRVFKSGKQYKFSMYNPQTGQWEESPAIADREEAENMREFAFKKRFDELTQ